jgi:hypothetical protein
MRLVAAPEGTPFEPSASGETVIELPAAFGPGRRYWTMDGLAIVAAGQLVLVLADGGPPRAVLSAPLADVSVQSKPRWSFGTGLYLEIAGEHYTVEPEPLYGHAATPGRIKRARQAARDLERALTGAAPAVSTE